MGVQQILDTIGNEWEVGSAKEAGTTRKRWLQTLSDVIGRPVNNRVTASTNAVAVNLNGAAQSTGIGTGPIMPSRYGEHLVQARVTFSISANGTLYAYVYRTTGAIPANGAAPNGGDVIVGGDAFAGPATVAGQTVIGTLSIFDMGLKSSQSYRYYLAVLGTNGLTANFINASQIIASEL
jgi:hypothetical protein